jgi:hypothetical protein
MRPIAFFGLGGADPPMNVVGTWGGPKAFEMGGVKHEAVGTSIMTRGGGFRNTLEVFGGVGEIHEYIRNASLAIQFSSHRIATVYHCCGESSEGHPSVRQATWSWIFSSSPWQNFRTMCAPRNSQPIVLSHENHQHTHQRFVHLGRTSWFQGWFLTFGLFFFQAEVSNELIDELLP